MNPANKSRHDPTAAGDNHHSPEPSPWVERFAPLIIEAGGGGKAWALDIACGDGRHTRLLASLGILVMAIDRDVAGLRDLGARDDVEIIEADLETPQDGAYGLPIEGRGFDGIVITNYLFRPLFPAIFAALNPGGILIYETFAAGNENIRRPRNPDHLLTRGELLERVGGGFHVIAFEEGMVTGPSPAVIQRICAAKSPASDIQTLRL
ncbi:MAG: class I SAM-dependent methyltransferase [Alphaproteobacteria bacterium]